jgi:hypothetical protein
MAKARKRIGSLLSVIELCASALAEDKEQELAWHRKVYVWRKAGKILPDGPPYTQDSGASKRYTASAIPLIGVLLFISNRFPAVEVLDEISRALQRSLTANQAVSRTWAAALARAASYSSGRTLLTIAFPTYSRDGFSIRFGNSPIIISDEDIDIYVIDISFVFYALLEGGISLFGEGFQFTSAPRARRP